MTNDELKILIGRYFNGETSLDEEKLLRQLLAAKDCPDIEEADEARAVMAFSLATPDATGETYKTTTTVKQRKKHLVWWNCAAAAIVAAALITPALRPSGSYGECVAYVNGTRIDDTETVTAMMFSELGEAAKASNQIAYDMTLEWHQMADAFNALN